MAEYPRIVGTPLLGGLAVARIPESELERLQLETLVKHLTESRGVKLEHRGSDLHFPCPSQDDAPQENHR